VSGDLVLAPKDSVTAVSFWGKKWSAPFQQGRSTVLVLLSKLGMSALMEESIDIAFFAKPKNPWRLDLAIPA